MGDMADILSTFTNLGSMSSYWIDKMGIASVKSYGAIGDGSTDDTEAIQECIDVVIAAGQKVVYLPHGTYLNTGLTNYASVTFLGDNSAFSGTVYTVVQWQDVIDSTYFVAAIGALADLTTLVKTSIVAAINSIKTEVGAAASLPTTDKTSLVAGITEIYTNMTSIISTSVSQGIAAGLKKIRRGGIPR